MTGAESRVRRGARQLLAGVAILLTGAGALGAQAPERGAFVVLRGQDTLAVERFERTPTSLRSTLVERVQGNRAVLESKLAPAALVTEMRVRAGRASAPDTARPLQDMLLVFQGDTAVMSGSGVPTPLRVPAPYGTVPYVNLAGTSLEQIVLRARATHGDTVRILAGTNTVVVSVKPQGADSVVLDLGGVQIRLAVDPAGRVLGGNVPAQGVRFLRVADATLGAGPKPDYSAPPDAPYTAEEVKLAGPAGALVGTLTLPRRRVGRLPAVVTITGSGQEDRDESLGSVAPGYRPFRQIADTLSRRGIAVLRLDDRGFGESGGDATRATSQDFAQDIAAGVAWLRTRPEIDPARIALVGHSEGGIIGPMVAAADPRIRALVLLAGTAYDGRRVLRYQLGYGLKRDTTLTGAALERTVAARLAALDSTPQPWMRYFLGYDPLPTIRRVKAPVLVLQGELDRQVTAEQAPLLAQTLREAGNRDVTLRVFPGLNHLFLRDGTGDPQNYPKLASYRIDGQVLGTLADWLAVRLAASKEPARPARE